MLVYWTWQDAVCFFSIIFERDAVGKHNSYRLAQHVRHLQRHSVDVTETLCKSQILKRLAWGISAKITGSGNMYERLLAGHDQ